MVTWWRRAILAAAGLILLASPLPTAAATPTTTEIRPPTKIIGWFEPIHLVALVRPTPSTTGSVIMFRDGIQVGIASTSPDGAATFDLPGQAPGTYTFVAQFDGSASSDPSTSDPLEVTVIDDRTPVTVTIASGQNPSLRNDFVPFTVTVEPTPDTGVVTVFHDGNGTQKAIDPSGVTTINHRFVETGEFLVSACFGLSTKFQDTCATAGVVHQVRSIATETTMTIDPTTLYRDEPIKITVGVTPVPDVSTSVVVKRDGLGLPVWTIPLDPVTGVGRLEVPAEEVVSAVDWGDNVFVAMFSDTDHMDGSVSDQVTLHGLRDPTSMTMQADPDPIVPGERVFASATIDPAPSEGSSIEFWTIGPNGSNLFGSGPTDADGTATGSAPTTSLWPLGSYRIEARFLGDIRHGPSSASDLFELADSIAPSFGFILDGPDPSTATRDIVVRSGSTAQAAPSSRPSYHMTAWLGYPCPIPRPCRGH